MQPSLTSDTWIGRLLGDRQRYRIEKRLGSGGMGDVFLAMDTILGRHVALKLLKDTMIASAELRKRFEREVAVCAALKSSHIVQVNDYGVTSEGYPFYTMEYLQGQTLGNLLRQKRQLPIERTVQIVTEVCEGLQLAHAGVTLWRNGATASEHVKVVHRDLKPDNIFLVKTATEELVKLLDFGIAKIRNDETEHTTQHLTNMFLGTYHFAAPEQLEGEKDIDGRADIYSLGIILYEMLSGTDPFGFGDRSYNNGVNGISWALAHTTKPPVPLQSQPGSEHLSQELEAVVMRCLQKSPDERFASVEELQQALLAAVAVPQQSILLTKADGEPESQQIAPVPNQSQPPTPIVTGLQGQIAQMPTRYSLPPLSQPSSRQLPSSIGFPAKSTLLLAGVSAIVTMAATNIAYNYLKTQPSNSNSQLQVKDQENLNQSELEKAKKIAQAGKFAEAMTVASKIPKTSFLYSTTQGLITQWSEIILKLAIAQFQAGKVDAAIAQAQSIPATSPAYQKAQAAIAQWKQDWQVAETQFSTAQKALDAAQWQAAIATANKVPDIDFWQKKAKTIIQQAQSQIAKAEEQPTYTPLPQILTKSPEPVEQLASQVPNSSPTRQIPVKQPVRRIPAKQPEDHHTPVRLSGGGWEDPPSGGSPPGSI